jgi:uncharacterized protein
MKHTIVGACRIDFYLPGVASLKEKRSILKPMLKRLTNTFNISVAEVDHQDVWQSAAIGIAAVSNNTQQVEQVIKNIIKWIEKHFPDAMITHEDMTIY